jgi:hypothetical protein
MSGRPSKYGPKYCSKVLKHMSKDRLKEVVASKLGISRDTLYQMFIRAYKQESKNLKVIQFE